MAEKLFSGIESSRPKQLVINGHISIGHLGYSHRFLRDSVVYLWRDWYTKEVYRLTYAEFLSIKPYPESPIPEPET